MFPDFESNKRPARIAIIWFGGATNFLSCESTTETNANAPKTSPALICQRMNPPIGQSNRALTPAQIMLAEGKLPEAFSRNLEDRIPDSRLHGRGAVVAHPEQPVPCLEEADVDLRRILVDA